MRNVPSGFGTRIQGELHSLWLGSIKSLSSKYWTSSLRICCFTRFIMYGCCFTGFKPSISSTSWWILSVLDGISGYKCSYSRIYCFSSSLLSGLRWDSFWSRSFKISEFLSFDNAGSDFTKFISSESIWFRSGGTVLTRFTDEITELFLSMYFLSMLIWHSCFCLRLPGVLTM